MLYTALEVKAVLSESEQNRVIGRFLDTILQISDNQHYFCNTSKKCHKFSIANTHNPRPFSVFRHLRQVVWCDPPDVSKLSVVELSGKTS